MTTYNWRLNILGLNIPPLRERRDDILPLLKSFLKELNHGATVLMNFTEDALDFLLSYHWPGNVRELRNFCERLTVGSHKEKWDNALLLRMLACGASRPSSLNLSNDRKIESALARTGGKIEEAAKLIGIHRSTLWRHRKRIEQEHSS